MKNKKKKRPILRTRIVTLQEGLAIVKNSPFQGHVGERLENSSC
jgi:hypothetical protein